MTTNDPQENHTTTTTAKTTPKAGSKVKACVGSGTETGGEGEYKTSKKKTYKSSHPEECGRIQFYNVWQKRN